MAQASTNNRSDKILIVDDDARIRDLLRRYLAQEGFEVMLAEDSKAMNRILLRDTVDLIVLDLMMPGEDGLSVCRRLRSANDRTPIIMLTAKGEDVDRIVGLEVGADDYLSKPFNPRELLARIHAVLRRRPATEVPGAPSSDQEVAVFGPFSFDMGLRTLHKNGEELPLTTGEFAMLKTLVRHPRQPLSREKLAQLARGREFEPFDRSWTCRCPACASSSSWTRLCRATSRRYGALAMCLCRTAPIKASLFCARLLVFCCARACCPTPRWGRLPVHSHPPNAPEC